MMSTVFDTDELELIRESLERVLAGSAPSAVPGALLDSGWNELVSTDAAAALSLLSEAAGRARSVAPVLDVAVLWACGIQEISDVALIADGLAVAGADRAARFLVIGPTTLALVAAGDVRLSPAGGFDPAFGLSRADLADPGEPFGDAAVARRAVATGRRALAAEMVGGVEQMLADTVGYVLERHQYGRAIGSFQSVKHRLAEVRVALAAARAAVRVAWEESEGDDAELLAIAAKCLAGRAQRVASTHCFQVHGGIAFTVEHGFQQWVRRGLLLDTLFGGSDALTIELGHRLRSLGRVPRHPALERAAGR